MITSQAAVEPLYAMVKNSQYNDTKTSSCVRVFVHSYPKITAEFKLDGPAAKSQNTG